MGKFGTSPKYQIQLLQKKEITHFPATGLISINGLFDLAIIVTYMLIQSFYIYQQQIPTSNTKSNRGYRSCYKP